MHTDTSSADRILHQALKAVERRDPGFPEVLDELPEAIYVTDAGGMITFYNRACVAFAGRTPRVGEDRWCVTWKLYTEDGRFLPHDECPMAVAIREKRPIRGIEAVAERPDGSRIAFTPYPTPLLDSEGRLIGAINMLVDVSARKQAEALLVQAKRCRRLAASITDSQTAYTLKLMAGEYEEKALSSERPN
jgi:PAS domain S-box-containing protein